MASRRRQFGLPIGGAQPVEIMLQCGEDGRMLDKPLHVLVIDEDRIRASIIEEGLAGDGATRVTVLADMRELMRRVVELDPDVIVIDLENPNRDALEHAFQVSRAARRPVAMFVDRADHASIEAAVEAGVSAYVVDGLKKERVKPILDTAIMRYRAFERLQRDLEQARSELAGRKAIDRAKGILMRTKSLSEEEAYALLRRTAMNTGRRITDIADSLILASGLLSEDDGP